MMILKNYENREKGLPLHDFIDVGKIRSLAQNEDIGANIPWLGQLMGIPQLFAYLIQADTWLREYKVEII